MQSFILTHSHKEKRDKYLEKFLSDQQISTFDVSRIMGETSIGIEEIRMLQQQLLYKPLKGDKKAIIIEDAQTLTTEAQNALLKVLEEPPSHTIFFLSTANVDVFLPTILSRCSLIVLSEEKQIFTNDQLTNLQSDAEILFSKNINSQLYLAEKIASDKQTMIIWLKNMILYLRQIILEDPKANNIPNILKRLQEAYRILATTNTQPRITLEHTFLTI